MSLEFYVGPVPGEGETPYSSYRAHSDDWPPGRATAPMTALLAAVRRRTTAADEAVYAETRRPLEEAVAHDCIYVSVHVDLEQAEAIYGSFQEAAAELGLMLYDPHMMLAFLPGQAEPADGMPPPQGPYGLFDAVEVFVSAAPSQGRAACEVFDAWRLARPWPPESESGVIEPAIADLITRVRERLQLPDESYTVDHASLETYAAEDGLHLRLDEEGGLGLWEAVFEAVRIEAQSAGLLYYDPVREIAYLPGQQEPVPCVRADTPLDLDSDDLAPWPAPKSPEDWHVDATAYLSEYIGPISHHPEWPHHLDDARVMGTRDQMSSGPGDATGAYFYPLLWIRVYDQATSEPVQARVDAWRCGPDGCFDDRDVHPAIRENRGWTRADEDGVWAFTTWLAARGPDVDLADERSWIHVGVRAPGYHCEYRRVLLLDHEDPATPHLTLPDMVPTLRFPDGDPSWSCEVVAIGLHRDDSTSPAGSSASIKRRPDGV